MLSGRPVRYISAHHRVYSIWGKAKEYLCIGCGRQAHQWSYDGTDPTELAEIDMSGRLRGSTRPMRYSIWPEFYAPKCVSCHKTADLAALSQESAEKSLVASR